MAVTDMKNAKFETLNLNRKSNFKLWKNFLIDHGISNFNDVEVKKIDQTVGAFDEQHKMIATGSVSDNVLKYVAVEDGSAGALFNQVITKLTTLLAQQGIFHWFVFTKPKYAQSFQNVGFLELATSHWGVILEKGDQTVGDYTEKLLQGPQQSQQKVGAIVMNANPFTKGHHFLVKHAADENDLVYIFVVNNDVALFTTKERIELVKEGTKGLENVVVVNGADYMVSYTTFPAYFIKTSEDIAKYQTTLDARIFRNKIAPPLNITRRYLGTEPYSRVTDIYNETLREELPPVVKPIIIERKQSDSGQFISASSVRQKILSGQLQEVQEIVPRTTFDFISSNLQDLQNRAEKL